MKYISKHKNIIIYGLLLIGLVLMHTHFTINTNDDVYFQKVVFSDIFSFIGHRYNVWTSRIIIEFCLVGLLELPSIVWYILNSCMVLIATYSITYIFTKRRPQDILLVFCLFFAYPFYQMSDAGWYATTLNYLWPLALGLFALIPIKNHIDGKKEPKYMYPLYIVALLFACNQELMCAIILAFYSLYLVYSWKDKKIDKFLVIQWLLAIASIVFILTCPGNAVRNADELLTWYPEYANFSFIHKGILGLLSTFSISFLEMKFPLIIFVCLIPIALWKNKNIWIKINSFIPLALLLLMNLLPYQLRIITLFNTFIAKVSVIPMKYMALWLIIIMCIVFICSVLTSLYFIFKKENILKRFAPILIFLAGLTSRLIMGFSPTVYASGVRTFIYYYIAMIICSICIILNLLKDKNKKLLYILIGIFGIIALYVMITTMLDY